MNIFRQQFFHINEKKILLTHGRRSNCEVENNIQVIGSSFSDLNMLLNLKEDTAPNKKEKNIFRLENGQEGGHMCPKYPFSSLELFKHRKIRKGGYNAWDD